MPLQSRQGAPCTRPGTHIHTHTRTHLLKSVCACGWVGERCQGWCIHISLSKTHQRFRPPSPVNRNKMKEKKKSKQKSIFLSSYFRAWALGIFLGLVGLRLTPSSLLHRTHLTCWYCEARRSLQLPPRWCITNCKCSHRSAASSLQHKKTPNKLRQRWKKKKKKTTWLGYQQVAFWPCPHTRRCFFLF